MSNACPIGHFRRTASVTMMMMMTHEADDRPVGAAISDPERFVGVDPSSARASASLAGMDPPPVDLHVDWLM